MKKIFIFLFGIAMVCENVNFGIKTPTVYRCENDEVICYSHIANGGISCKWKNEVKK